MRKRVPLAYDQARGWFVDLPAYDMIPATFAPVTTNVLTKNGAHPKADPRDVLALNPTVEVDIPAVIALDPQGKIDRAKLRAMFREHQRYGSSDWRPPELLEP
jgi:hypothetical protein